MSTRPRDRHSSCHIAFFCIARLIVPLGPSSWSKTSRLSCRALMHRRSAARRASGADALAYRPAGYVNLIVLPREADILPPSKGCCPGRWHRCFARFPPASMRWTGSGRPCWSRLAATRSCFPAAHCSTSAASASTAWRAPGNGGSRWALAAWPASRGSCWSIPTTGSACCCLPRCWRQYA
jgi:hypothetical protein